MSFDTIIIGAGLGGLSAAAALSKEGQRVLVLEQHNKPGGMIHSFSRKDYKWNIGTHYMGRMHKGDSITSIFNHLTDNSIDFKNLESVVDDVYLMDYDYHFRIMDSQEKTMANLYKDFPEEKQGLDQFRDYLISIGKSRSKFTMPYFFNGKFAQFFYKIISRRFKKIEDKTVQQVLDELFTSKKLKLLLSFHAAKMGIQPEKISFLFYCIVFYNLFHGGFYPTGSGDAIIKALLSPVNKQNGKVLFKARVSKIITDSGKAMGVQLTSGKEYFASSVISSCGISETLNGFIDISRLPGNYRKTIKSLDISSSFICLYIGLKGDIQDKISTSNFRFIKGESINFYTNPLKEEWDPAYISVMFQSVRDKSFEGSSFHTAEILVPCRTEFFEQWEGTRLGKRGEEYKKLKERLTRKLTDLFRGYFPEIGENIDYTELATPLTFQHYTLHNKGTIYGLGMTPEKFRIMNTFPMTPVENLYLTGSDIFFFGIQGSILSGVITAGKVIKKNLILKYS